jgi:hypothetical protein
VENSTQRAASCPVLLTNYYSGNQIRKVVMGMACSICGAEEEYIQRFGGEI